ncbi:lysozyme [Pusillimonas sp.]|uniref:lysozyme n=1 Tax=Pusillimonas sp. TaxID=3040095 RepID=UPI0037CBCD0D
MSLRTKIVAGALAVSAAGLGFIGFHEGTSYSAYPDPAHGWSVPTICVGHTGPDVHKGLVATPAMCEAWLAKDSQKAANAVLECSGQYPLKQHEFDALVSFTFNVGTGAFCSSTLARMLRDGDRVGAIKQFDRWVYVTRTRNGKWVSIDCRIRSNNCYGLYTRRMAEKRLFATGAYHE